MMESEEQPLATLIKMNLQKLSPLNWAHDAATVDLGRVALSRDFL